MDLTRREVLTWSALGTGAVVLGNMGSLLAASPAAAASPRIGAPVLDPAGILDLPSGFSYQIVSRAGDPLPGGGLTPGRHDGTASFKGPQGGVRLVQNHEIGTSDPFPALAAAEFTYDPKAKGGTTTLTLDNHLNRVDEYVSLAGTFSNCAGGLTPWGTWLTCEETETKAGTPWSGNGQSGSYSRDHGYVFEVFGDGRALPKPIKAFGRYAHEAVAVDPSRTRVYLSEDASNPNGLFYRWTAPRGVKLAAGCADLLGATEGTLEAMAIMMDDGSVLPDVAYLTSAQLGRPFPVKWVTVAERDAQTTSVRKQFTDEITRGKKFEGVFGTDKGVYVVNSFAFNTGDLPEDAVKHDGMVWFYSYDEQTITLVTYFPHQSSTSDGTAPRYDGVVFDGPDNVTVTPWGSLVLAEDGVGASHVLSSVPGGPTYAIARNQLNIGTASAPEFSEFTGPTFSADGEVLFVNIQVPGITLAITGPWEKFLG